MKRTIAVAILGLWTLACIAGCVVLQKTEETQEPEHLLRVALWDYENTQYDQDLIEGFEAENPDIEVEIISYRSEVYPQNLQTLLESGARVDVIYVHQMSMLTELVEEGFAISLDELAQRDGVDLSDYQYSEYLCDADGNQMALPYRIDRFLLYYNKDMFDAAGLAYPDSDMTWDDFYETATQLQAFLDQQDTEAEQYSLFSTYMPTHWADFLTTRPFSVTNMNYQQLQNGMSLLIRMQEEGLMVPMQQIRAQRGVQRMFEDGNYGMYITGTWLMHYLKIDGETGNSSMNWGVAEYPHWDGTDNITASWITSLSISRESEEIDAAWRFLQYICGKQGSEIMARNFMIPSYRDEEIDALLAEQQERYDISIPLDADSFDPPQQVYSIRESEARSQVLDTVGQTVLGLISTEDGLAQMHVIQDTLFSQNFVESYNN